MMSPKKIKVKIKSVPYVDFKGLPIWDRLMECDLSLSNHDGMSLYTKKESLAEINRHHSWDNFSQLIEAITGLPDGVLINW